MGKCRGVQLDLPDYVRHELPDARYREITEHIGQCGKCAEELKNERGLQRLCSGLKPLEPPPLPPGFLYRLHKRVREAQEGQS